MRAGERLREYIDMYSINISALAKRIEMPSATFYDKLNGRTEFTISEAIAICEDLRLSKEERDYIFFSH